MNYKKYGLVNTKQMLSDALRDGYAIGAFNFYNMETLRAILAAAREMHSPVILAVSESALDYMDSNMLMAMIDGAKITPDECIALHLDHGHSYEICSHAIDIGFSSVMLDASKLPFDENIAMSARVAKYAHEHGATVEAELGLIDGHEDNNTNSRDKFFTRPNDVVKFVSQTGIDSLAISIGTSHGAYKRKTDTEELRFDILTEIAQKLPEFPLVLHGASNIPDKFISDINATGGNIVGARGIPTDQLQRAVTMNICKINVDSDSRLAFTAGVRSILHDHPDAFNPRDYLAAGMGMVYNNAMDEIQNIMNSANRLK